MPDSKTAFACGVKVVIVELSQILRSKMMPTQILVEYQRWLAVRHQRPRYTAKWYDFVLPVLVQLAQLTLESAHLQ